MTVDWQQGSALKVVHIEDIDLRETPEPARPSVVCTPKQAPKTAPGTNQRRRSVKFPYLFPILNCVAFILLCVSPLQVPLFNYDSLIQPSRGYILLLILLYSSLLVFIATSLTNILCGSRILQEGVGPFFSISVVLQATADWMADLDGTGSRKSISVQILLLVSALLAAVCVVSCRVLRSRCANADFLNLTMKSRVSISHFALAEAPVTIYAVHTTCCALTAANGAISVNGSGELISIARRTMTAALISFALLCSAGSMAATRGAQGDGVIAMFLGGYAFTVAYAVAAPESAFQQLWFNTHTSGHAFQAAYLFAGTFFVVRLLYIVYKFLSKELRSGDEEVGYGSSSSFGFLLADITTNLRSLRTATNVSSTNAGMTGSRFSAWSDRTKFTSAPRQTRIRFTPGSTIPSTKQRVQASEFWMGAEDDEDDLTPQKLPAQKARP